MEMHHRFRLPVALLIAIALLAVSSCQGPASSGDEGTAAHTDTMPQGTADPVTVTSCYLHTHERDSVRLRLTITNDTVSGTLHFKNYQIDGSQGTVRGQFQGDTLFLVYDFHAEGTHNMTEEAFLKQGTDLVRGFGDREEDKHLYRFTDRNAIEFSTGQIFKPVSCN